MISLLLVTLVSLFDLFSSPRGWIIYDWLFFATAMVDGLIIGAMLAW